MLNVERPPRIEIPHVRLQAICRRYGVRRLSLFGSVLESRFGPDSDVDMLVEFEPAVRLGLRFFELERELTDLVGRRVDLNTFGFLSQDIRGEVERTAQVLYDIRA